MKYCDGCRALFVFLCLLAFPAVAENELHGDSPLLSPRFVPQPMAPSGYGFVNPCDVVRPDVAPAAWPASPSPETPRHPTFGNTPKKPVCPETCPDVSDAAEMLSCKFEFYIDDIIWPFTKEARSECLALKAACAALLKKEGELPDGMHKEESRCTPVKVK